MHVVIGKRNKPQQRERRFLDLEKSAGQFEQSEGALELWRLLLCFLGSENKRALESKRTSKQ
jgi:hypothetical protein